MAKTNRHRQKSPEERDEIGRRVRRARDLANETLASLAAKIHVTESILSLYERGDRPLPAELVPLICHELHVSHEYLLGISDHEEQRAHPFGETRNVLDQLIASGLEAVYADRARALFHLCPVLRRMYRGNVLITGSSLKGLQQDSDHEFLKLLRSRHQDIAVHIIMTHPADGFAREDLERRSTGSIVGEIFQGIRWLTGILEIPQKQIRFMRATPTCFSIFLEDGQEGTALINPYPLMRQAFSSFSLIVRQVHEQGDARARSIYRLYRAANFPEEWQTVGIEPMLKQCLNPEPDTKKAADEEAVLKREAAALEKDLRHPNSTEGI